MSFWNISDSPEIIKSICVSPKIGIVNGLWANDLGIGGLLPIETLWYPSNEELKIKATGSLEKVIKESTEVACSLAWNNLTHTQQESLRSKFKKNPMGIHIHCPEGATPKDGPSAGAAITTAIYSLLNDKKIKNNFGMTGEITLQGDVTAIGGLELKILGGIRAGVTHFIYPKNNEKDFQKFIKKENYQDTVKNIKFTSVNHISEIFKIIFI